jgi:hypothetical protein
MHPLAHAWASDRLDASEKEEARIAADSILALSFKAPEFEPIWSQIQPHVESYVQAWPLKPSLI